MQRPTELEFPSITSMQLLFDLFCMLNKHGAALACAAYTYDDHSWRPPACQAFLIPHAASASIKVLVSWTAICDWYPDRFVRMRLLKLLESEFCGSGEVVFVDSVLVPGAREKGEFIAFDAQRFLDRWRELAGAGSMMIDGQSADEIDSYLYVRAKLSRDLAHHKAAIARIETDLARLEGGVQRR